MREFNVKTTYPVDAYQHISNGGISISLKTDTHGDGRETHDLEIGLSNFGIIQRCTIPVFATTPNILRIIADELEAKNVGDPSYLSPILTHVTFADKEDMYFRVIDGKVAQVKYEDCYGPLGGGQVANNQKV